MKTIVWETLPTSLEELKKLPQAGLTSPEDTAALTVAALCAYPTNKDDALEMLDYLRGPAPMTNYDKSFLQDRFRDGDHIPFSYFEGASPDNDYTPSKPYTINVADDAHGADPANEGYIKVFLTSSGADSPRPVVLRNKPSTGQWFLNTHSLMVQVRKPKSKDVWA